MKITKHQDGTVTIAGIDQRTLTDIARGLGWLSLQANKAVTSGVTPWGEKATEWDHQYHLDMAQRTTQLENLLDEVGHNRWSHNRYLPERASVELEVRDDGLNITKDGRKDCLPS